MANIDLPNICVVDSTFGLTFVTQMFESPLNGYVQTNELAGARWRASYVLPTLTELQAGELKSFFAKMRGRANTFLAYDANRDINLGAGGGSPSVNGDNQVGSALAFEGATPNVANWLVVGDYFEVNGEFKMVISNVDTDSGGRSTIEFSPPLRKSPINNQAINIVNPRCRMMLTSDDAFNFSSDRNKFVNSITIEGVEKL